MKKELSKFKGHYIVCGFGRIGKSVAEGLQAEGFPLCVLESDQELEGDLKDSGHLYLIGDATDEAVLQSAGLDRAKAVLALLASDADNLFLTITAKELSPSVTVISVKLWWALLQALLEPITTFRLIPVWDAITIHPKTSRPRP